MAVLKDDYIVNVKYTNLRKESTQDTLRQLSVNISETGVCCGLCFYADLEMYI